MLLLQHLIFLIFFTTISRRRSITVVIHANFDGWKHFSATQGAIGVVLTCHGLIHRNLSLVAKNLENTTYRGGKAGGSHGWPVRRGAATKTTNHRPSFQTHFQKSKSCRKIPTSPRTSIILPIKSPPRPELIRNERLIKLHRSNSVAKRNFNDRPGNRPHRFIKFHSTVKP